MSRQHELPHAIVDDDVGNDLGAVESAIDFLLSVDRLKQVRRRNPLVEGQRRERTAEHCWHVALAVMCLSRYASEPIDVGRAVQLAVVHDLPETLVGDTFVYGRRTAGRRQREERGMSLLTQPLGDGQDAMLMDAWREYEYETTPEGRFVMAIDVLLPIYINFVAGTGSSWARHRILANDVRKRVEHVSEIAPDLAAIANRMIDRAVHIGLLR